MICDSVGIPESIRYYYEIYLDYKFTKKHIEKLNILNNQVGKLNLLNMKNILVSKEINKNENIIKENNLYFPSIYENCLKIEEFIDHSYLLSEKFYFPNKLKDSKGEILIEFFRSLFKVKSYEEIFYDLKYINKENSIKYISTLAKHFKISDIHDNSIHTKNDIFLVDNSSSKYDKISNLYLPDLTIDGEKIEYQNLFNNTDIIFLSKKYFTYDEITNKNSVRIFNKLGVKCLNDILEKIHQYINEENLTFMLNNQIKMDRYFFIGNDDVNLFCSRNSNSKFHLLSKKVKEFNFLTEKNTRRASSKNLLNSLYSVSSYFKFENYIDQCIFISRDYIKDFSSIKLKFFYQCGLNTLSSFVSKIENIINEQNNVDIIKILILQKFIENNDFVNNQINSYLRENNISIENKNLIIPKLHNIKLFTRDNSYLLQKEIYSNDMLVEENGLKLETILNLGNKKNIFLSNAYLEYDEKTIKNMLYNSEDYDSFKYFTEFSEKSFLHFNNFFVSVFDLKDQIEIIYNCEEYIDNRNCVKFLKEIFFYVFDYKMKKKNMIKLNEVTDTLMNKKIFLNKNNFLTSNCKLYFNNIMNTDMKIEENLPSNFILNESYILTEEDKLRIENAESKWFEFLSMLGIKKTLIWEKIHINIINDLNKEDIIFNYFIEQISQHSKYLNIKGLFKDNNYDNKSKENLNLNNIQNIKIRDIDSLCYFELCKQNSNFSKIFLDCLFSNKNNVRNLKSKQPVNIKIDNQNYSMHFENFMIWFLKKVDIIPSSLDRNLNLTYFYEERFLISKNKNLVKIFPVINIEIHTDFIKILNLRRILDLNCALEILIYIINLIKSNICLTHEEEINIKELFDIFYQLIVENSNDFMNLEYYDDKQDTLLSINNRKIMNIKNIIKNIILISLDNNNQAIKNYEKVNGILDNNCEFLLLSNLGSLSNPKNLFFIDIDYIDLDKISIDNKISLSVTKDLKSFLKISSNMRKFKEINKILGLSIIDKNSITITCRQESIDKQILIKKLFLRKILIYCCYLKREKSINKLNIGNENFSMIKGDFSYPISQETLIFKMFSDIKEKFGLIVFHLYDGENLEFNYSNKKLFEDNIFIRNQTIDNKNEIFISNIGNNFFLKRLELKLFDFIIGDILRIPSDDNEMKMIILFEDDDKILDFYQNNGYFTPLFLKYYFNSYFIVF